MNEFKNKIVVVSGAAKGIGKACVEDFVKQGAKVALLDIDKAAGLELEAQHPESTRYFYADMEQGHTLKQVIADVVSYFGSVDFLINNAGIQGEYKSVSQTSEAEWDKVMNINLKSYFLMAKHCIPFMQGRHGSCIVNMASVNSFHCGKNIAAYATSKAAILGLSRSIATDYAPELRCVAICPGTVETPMLDKAFERFPNPGATKQACRDMHLVKRMAQADEISALVLHVCSDKGSFMTGQAIRIDGGLGIMLGGTE